MAELWFDDVQFGSTQATVGNFTAQTVVPHHG
jgi:hypothetical protein